MTPAPSQPTAQHFSQLSSKALTSQPIALQGKAARHYPLFQDSAIATAAIDERNSDEKGSDEKGSDKKIPAHFYGGNGFAVGVYQPLLQALSASFQLSSLAMQGYWYDIPKEKVLSREDDAAALIAYLEKTQDAPVVGIGHSMGATATAMAAVQRPDLFSRLYLIEPVTFTRQQQLLYNLVPRFIKMKNEPFASTPKKTARWDSIGSFYNHLRGQKAFKRISDEHLRIYAQNSLERQPDGQYQLLFMPEQELAGYFGTPYVTGALKALTIPYTLIIGKPTLFINPKVRKTWQQFVPDAQIIQLSDYGHLLPLEAPAQCAQVIMQRELDVEAN